MGYGVDASGNCGGDGAAAAAMYTDKELTDSVLNFMIAGRDTTAVTLSWFVYCVCQNPEVGERIFEESRRVLGLQEHDLQGIGHGRFEAVAERLTYEALGRMHYLHAALTETLRLYPAVPRVSSVCIINSSSHRSRYRLEIDHLVSPIDSDSIDLFPYRFPRIDPDRFPYCVRLTQVGR
jgi:hypothetical protein